ncbi:hypothetical protein [Mesorhizobium sp. B263B2A]|uniref:hypothetical protein n=1 Tax=Mesorhizobium sp. B263B2A TaxID=2876669 RepID=UPI001CD06181|nr:hypothetical protein [Mesorhizobium sp. B263B2A]MCA0032777.1 hypothetical protein [Mesorhizobium sp. B263B2A]
MSEVHSDELHEMCRQHFNEPMISFDKIVRCIGYGETGVDCYVITKGHGGEIVWNTCVGGYFFLDRLKGQGYVKAVNGEDWDDLTRLDSNLTCGGATKESEFRLVLQHDDMEDGKWKPA